MTSIKAYILSRPDRYRLVYKNDRRIYNPFLDIELEHASMQRRKFWPEFYSKQQDERSVLENRAWQSVVVERIVRAVRSLSMQGQRDFKVLQDGSGDASLLMLVRERLKEAFPSSTFQFFGVDAQADDIARAIRWRVKEPDVEIKNGRAEDPHVFGDQVTDNFFDVIIDYGLTVKPVITQQQAEIIFKKWSTQLKPGGLVFSMPYLQDPWLEIIGHPSNLNVLSHIIPENVLNGQSPRFFTILQKMGGHDIDGLYLMEGIGDELAHLKTDSQGGDAWPVVNLLIAFTVGAAAFYALNGNWSDSSILTSGFKFAMVLRSENPSRDDVRRLKLEGIQHIRASIAELKATLKALGPKIKYWGRIGTGIWAVVVGGAALALLFHNPFTRPVEGWVFFVMISALVYTIGCLMTWYLTYMIESELRQLRNVLLLRNPRPFRAKRPSEKDRPGESGIRV